MEAANNDDVIPTTKFNATCFMFTPEPLFTAFLGGSASGPLPGSVGGLADCTGCSGNGGLIDWGRSSRRLRLCSRTSLEGLNMVSKDSALTRI